MRDPDQLFTESYDSKLKLIPFYKQFPHMMPWIGVNFESKSHKKIFLLAESHYLPSEKSKIHLDSENWYKSKSDDLTVIEQKWTNTREIIGSGKNRDWDLGESPGHRIYLNIEKAILETGFDPDDKTNLFQYCAYANFFLRPAKEGDSIDFDNVDEKIAMETLFELLKKLNPDLVCILSIKAWKVCEKWVGCEQQKDGFRLYDMDDKPYKTEFFPHPTSPWWNTVSETYKFFGDMAAQSGKEKFIGFLKREKAFNY